MKTKKQFILDTLLPYKEDRTTCAIEGGECAYLTSDGKKCAVGKYMKNGEWQDSETNFYDLIEEYEPKEFLTEEALKQNLNVDVWNSIQAYHDNLCFLDRDEVINTVVLPRLERLTGLKLPELKV